MLRYDKIAEGKLINQIGSISPFCGFNFVSASFRGFDLSVYQEGSSGNSLAKLHQEENPERAVSRQEAGGIKLERISADSASCQKKVIDYVELGSFRSDSN